MQKVGRNPRSWVVAAGTVLVAQLSVFVCVPRAGAVEAPHSQGRPGDAAGARASRRAHAMADLDQSSGGQAQVTYRNGTGNASLIGGPRGVSLGEGPNADHSIVARSFVDRYGALYGIDDPATELAESRRFPAPDGGTSVRFREQLGGVPVIGAEVAVQVSPDGRARSSLGDTVTPEEPDLVPTVTAADATVAAITATNGHGVGPLPAATTTEPSLWVYDPVLLGAGGPPGQRLVWRLDVSTGARRELVLVDAHTGAVALHFDQNAESKSRTVCDRNDVRGLSQYCTSSPVRVEGGPATGIADADNAYLYAGVTYDFYLSRFGRDSVDGVGLPLASTVRYCTPVSDPNPCPLANAFWNGSQMVYGNGYAGADDVVAHELQHGVTQYTSQMFYFSQTGAINESMSDVMGELVDLTDGFGNDTPSARWLMGEDLPGSGIGGTGAIRSMSNPPVGSPAQPDRMTSSLFYGGSEDRVGVHRNSGVGNKAAYLIVDGGTFNGQTVTGLGVDRAALLYYQVGVAFLGPSSVYADLANALNQACADLIGTAGISAADCTNVAKAVTATEMTSQPTTPGSTVPAAPVCPAGTVVSNLFADDMENPASGSWITNTVSGTPWVYDTAFPASPVRSLAGEDVSTPGLLTMRRSAALVPPAGKTTYLRFNHAFQFDFDTSLAYDGGMVEYTNNGGTSWNDASPLFVNNGYNGTITTGFSNPASGRAAFVRTSPGYQSSRLNLSSLAGQSVMFRFSVGSDSVVGAYGWFVDDVAVYTCDLTGPPSAPLNLSATPMNGAAYLTWQTPASQGGSPIAGYRITATPGGATFDVGTTTQAVFPGLTNATSYTFVVAARNNDGYGPPSSPSGAVVPGIGPGYVALSPVRVLDSRSGIGLTGKWIAGQTRDLTVTGVAGVPSGAAAVVLNVTVTNASAASHLTLWPAGVGQPTASNLNFSAGRTIPNLVTVKASTGGQVSIFNNAGSVDVIADAVGYYKDGVGEAFNGLTPFRVLDSRDGTGGQSTPWPAGIEREVQVTGVSGSGVPASGVSAVVMNMTAVGPTADSHLTVWPADQAMPVASNLNFPAGRTIANLVIAKVSTDGKVKVVNNSGSVDVVVDVVGYYAAAPSGGRFTAVTPSRLVDSRNGTGGYATPWSAGLTRTVGVVGKAGVPPTGARAVIINMTAVSPTAATHLTAWDTGAAQPTASNLNCNAGDVIPALAVVKIGSGGMISVFNNSGSTNVVIDVVGWFD